MNPQAREELGNLSVIFWQDYYFAQNREVEKSFVEENKYRDYYEDNTYIFFPKYDKVDSIVHSMYYMYTYKTSGYLNTPFYGESFDANKFEYVVYYIYTLYLPDNIHSLGRKYPGLRLVLHFYVDVALYPGSEYVYFEILDKYGDWYDEFPPEFFMNTGNISLIRKFDVKRKSGGLKKGDDLSISLCRVLDKASVDKSLEKRNTGFQLTWYYEDSSGKRVEIEPKKEERLNIPFISFINLVFEAVTKHNISLETLWNIAKNYRVDYIHRKVNGKTPYCQMGSPTEVDMEYIDYFNSVLNISYTHKDGNVYKDNITNSLLSDGFQLFHYIARCEDMDMKSSKTFKTYIDSFNNDSATAILEAAIEMNNINSRKKSNFTWGESSVKALMKKIHSEFDLSIYKLKLLSSTTDDLGDVDDEPLRNILEYCMKNGDCEKLQEIIQNQGAGIFCKLNKCF